MIASSHHFDVESEARLGQHNRRRLRHRLLRAGDDVINRVGRTGRAGARGTATTFGTKSERGDIKKIERALNIRLTSQRANFVNA